MTTAGTCFQLLKPGLKANYIRSAQHTKNTAEEQTTRMYKNPEQFRRYQYKGEGKKDKHEALNRIGRKHVFTGLSITVALYSTVKKESLLTFTHF